MIRNTLLALCLTGTALCADEPVDVNQLSEAFGNFLGRSLAKKHNELPLDQEKVIEGIRKGYAGEPSPLSERDYQLAISALQTQEREKVAKENLEKAEAYLSTIDEKDEMNEIVPKKLYYSLLEAGEGPEVKENSSPLIHYTGKFIDGTVFGSSENTGPISMPLNNTIPGFRMGLVGMHEGEKRRLYIHPDLAYGTSGDLLPNSLLIFDIEVLNAEDAAE